MDDEPPATTPPDSDGDMDDGNERVAEEPEGGPGHPLRAQDAPALLPKEIG